MTKNSLFSTQEFIEASRKYVCIRIETYGSKKNEEMVRRLLGGKFVNTVFVLFDPTGESELSRTGRSPNQGLSKRGRKANDETVVSEMNRIVEQFEPKDNLQMAGLQDFDSLKEAINVASADQRLLVLVNVNQTERDALREKLKPVFTHADVIGKFHLDFLDTKIDETWTKLVTGIEDKGTEEKIAKEKPGIMIVRSSQFGLDGKVVAQLPLSQTVDEFKTALLAENKKFAEAEKRKDYKTHVLEGRKQGIEYDSVIPYGEDRDGDGEIDKKRRFGGGRTGKSKNSK